MRDCRCVRRYLAGGRGALLISQDYGERARARAHVCVRACAASELAWAPGWLKSDCILEENIKSLQSFTPSSPLKHSWLMRGRDRCGEGEKEAGDGKHRQPVSTSRNVLTCSPCMCVCARVRTSVCERIRAVVGCWVRG